MNKIELLGRQRGKVTQSHRKQMKYEGFPQCLIFVGMNGELYRSVNPNRSLDTEQILFDC